MDSMATTSTPIWVLLGNRHGDNQQLLVIAEALGQPFRAIPVRTNAYRKLPVWMRASSHVGWRTDEPLTAPWPRIVLAAGRKSVTAARWIRRQSGGYTKLVHINRPWAPLWWFDLVITTPQYALPARPNVLSNLMPFLQPSVTPAPECRLPDAAVSMPRPWTAVLIGGVSGAYVYSDETARNLAAEVSRQVRQTGGSAWLLDSPRTPSNIRPILEHSMEVPSQFIHWRNEGREIYRSLLATADRFVVTEDSASMATEAMLSDRPVSLFKLPVQPSWKRRFAWGWRDAAERAPASLTGRIFATLISVGLLTKARDMRLWHRALDRAGLLNGDHHPTMWAAQERERTLARIRALMQGV